MTNKKFSIRKLAVGTASVAIGFSASGTIDSTLANDYTNNYIATTNTTNTSNNYTVTTNPSNNYMYNSYNNRNHPLSPEEYTLKQAKDRALEEIQPYKELYKDNNYISGFIPEEAKELFNYIDKIDKSTSESEISNLLQELKNNEQNKFNTFLSSLNNLNTEELKELNITVTDKIARYKALALNSLHAIPNITIDDFKKYKDEIEKEPYKIDSPSNHKRYIESVKEEITRKYLVKDIYTDCWQNDQNINEHIDVLVVFQKK